MIKTNIAKKLIDDIINDVEHHIQTSFSLDDLKFLLEDGIKEWKKRFEEIKNSNLQGLVLFI